MTASIGFRSPHATQLQAAWLSDAAWQLEQADPPTGLISRRDLAADRVRANAQIRRWRRHPAQIDSDYMNDLTQTLRRWQARPREMRNFIGRHLSEPKPTIWFDRPADQPASEKLARMRRHGIQLDRRTRMLWFGETIFINGVSYRTDVPARTLLRRLADLRQLSVAEIKPVLAAKSSRQLVFDWLDAGWVRAEPGQD